MMLPIEYIRMKPWGARRGANVWARIERLNAIGVEEGSFLRGWHPHRRSRHMDIPTIPAAHFIRKFGRARYDALPRRAFYRDGHRKAVTYQAFLGANAP